MRADECAGEIGVEHRVPLGSAQRLGRLADGIAEMATVNRRSTPFDLVEKHDAAGSEPDEAPYDQDRDESRGPSADGSA